MCMVPDRSPLEQGSSKTYTNRITTSIDLCGNQGIGMSIRHQAEVPNGSAPDGTYTEHRRVMVEKGIKYSTAIINSTLQCGECSTTYGAYYMPSLVYGTPATTLSYKECEDIHRRVVAAIVPKMVLVRSAARKVVLWSATYCGLGLDHLSTIQNICLQYLIGHTRSKIITSKLIHHQLNYTQLEIGCPTQALGQDFKQ
jgi:hypothetical protein